MSNYNLIFEPNTASSIRVKGTDFTIYRDATAVEPFQLFEGACLYARTTSLKSALAVTHARIHSLTLFEKIKNNLTSSAEQNASHPAGIMETSKN